jgi:hypothetical protein
MRDSGRRASRTRPGTRGPGTIIGLVLLGLVAIIATARPNLASATALWRTTTPTTTVGPRGNPTPDPTSPPVNPAPSSSPPSPPSSPVAGGSRAGAVPATVGGHDPALRRAEAAMAVADARVPGDIDLDAGVPGVAPPPTIADDCSVDVSGGLQEWLDTLAPGTLVRPPAGACYRIDRGITLRLPVGLTIDGGTYRNTTTVKSFAGASKGRATFTVTGGSQVTFEDLTIDGANPGGYHPALAFEAGIALDGTAHAVIRNVAIDNVYGDGISLDPLRGAGDHASGTILTPTTDLTIDTVVISGSGRQGISLASVDSANIDDVTLSNVGIDTFDVEADQANEGARNVTIDGCTSSTWNGGSFFANGGAGGGSRTGDIVVENCQMLHPQGGDAVLVQNIPHATQPRGPITFTQDTLWCGESVYVACLEINNATVSVTRSVIRFTKKSTVHENVYDAGNTSSLSLVSDSVRGWKNLGQGRATSTVLVSGGSWIPAYNAAADPSVVAVSHPGTGGARAWLTADDTAGNRRSHRHGEHHARGRGRR